MKAKPIWQMANVFPKTTRGWRVWAIWTNSTPHWDYFMPFCNIKSYPKRTKTAHCSLQCSVSCFVWGLG